MKILFYAAIGLAFALLSLTGYTAPYTVTHYLTGYALLLHAALAPLFALCIAAWAVVYAPRRVFTEEDWLWLRNRDRLEERTAHGLAFGKKACFWLILIASLPVILSITLNMFPIFAAQTQPIVITVHYAGVILMSIGILGYAGCSWAQMDPDRYFTPEEKSHADRD
ncbi:MAG: hypothetical protein JXR73_00045 [Candidatus Omnitrophica bacterium]|nr:hypothetical protein [Candidatus Omnitrophota bacterium]